MSGPSVFIGSSTGTLAIAESVKRILENDANARVWNVSFEPGSWILQVILDYSQKSDFGLFVMAPDDRSVIKDQEQYSVRDNVLFEIGVFMGALGPKRTFVLWPSKFSGKLRLPSDLHGLTMVEYGIDIATYAREDGATLGKLKRQLSAINSAIEDLGPALRSSHNEIAWIDQLEQQREFRFKNGTESYKEIIAPAAAQRTKPWYPKTSVELLMTNIAEGYTDEVVDTIFWWLMVDGVLAFDNIHIWMDDTDDEDGDFHWSTSVNHTVFTDRGVAWLNQLRLERTKATALRSPSRARARTARRPAMER